MPTRKSHSYRKQTYRYQKGKGTDGQARRLEHTDILAYGEELIDRATVQRCAHTVLTEVVESLKLNM